jgi:lipoprotein-anchoring transpeptidase ErfK/SrfK
VTLNQRIGAGLVAVCGSVALVAGCADTQPDAPPDAAPAPSSPSRTTPAPTIAPTPGPTSAVPSSPGPTAGHPVVLHRGAQGQAVQALQQRLADLGYWIGPVDGEFGMLTQQAVYALQKAAGIARDGVVGPDTRAALDRGVRPAARTTSGHLVEVDLDRQLLLLVDNGRVQRIFNTSTGTFEYYWYGGNRHLADTPRGTWSVYRQVDGWDSGPLGNLDRPKYFNRQGIAVHGYPNVPPRPASHGCVRVSLAAMDWLWRTGQLPVGTTVRVY